MAPTMLTIPPEVLFQIAFYLEFEDFINLRNARKGLLERLNGERFNKEVTKVRKSLQDIPSM